MSDSIRNKPGFLDGLQDASFNKVPFQVSSSIISGRRNAVHMYPFKDVPYIEDMGAEPLKISMNCYLCGDDVYTQRDNLKKQCDTNTPGTLVHPSYGSVYAKMESFSFQEDVLAGSYLAVSINFIEIKNSTKQKILVHLPKKDTQGDVEDDSDELDDSADDDFLSDIGNSISSTVSTVSGVIKTTQSYVNTAVYAVGAITSTVQGFANQVLGVVNDASRIVNSVEGIGYAFDSDWQTLGNAFGSLTNPPTALNALPPGLTTQAKLAAATTLLINADTESRAQVTAAATAAVESVSAGSSVSDSVQALTEALRQGTASPADQIRLLSGLAAFTQQPVNSSSAIGMAISGAVYATASVARRAALSSLGRACASYQPNSSNDAQTVLSSVVPLFDNEISYASENGDAKSSAALKKLKSSIVLDMNTRSVGLSNVLNINLPGSIPLKRLAMRLYGDASRASEILARNPQIVHPSFCPTTGIEILSS